ncbi:MAG: hypothetical protein D6747_05250 [Chlorobiota bacterium]|nr:MAG: hypothetical protein D6747_05250 [Chlorobiota bacterium]
MPTPAQRTALAATVIGLLLWLSATLGRAIVTYDLYEPGTMRLRPVPIVQQLDQLRLAQNVALIGWASYGLTVAAAAGTALLWRGHLRREGYLAITLLLISASLAWQGWTAPTELALAREFPSRTVPPPLERYETIRALVEQRFFRQSPADLLSVLTAATAIVVLVVQPRRLPHG